MAKNEKKIDWLPANRRKNIDSCEDLGRFFHEYVDETKEKVANLKDKKLAPGTPVSDWEALDERIRNIEKTRNNRVASLWRHPFKKGEMRNDKDVYYFIQIGDGNDYVEFTPEMYDRIKDSKLGERFEHLVCKFDPKNASFSRF